MKNTNLIFLLTFYLFILVEFSVDVISLQKFQQPPHTCTQPKPSTLTSVYLVGQRLSLTSSASSSSYYPVADVQLCFFGTNCLFHVKPFTCDFGTKL